MLTWAQMAEPLAKELKVPFEKDEIALKNKVRLAWEATQDVH